jgi:hypothetical protein
LVWYDDVTHVKRVTRGVAINARKRAIDVGHGAITIGYGAITVGLCCTTK